MHRARARGHSGLWRGKHRRVGVHRHLREVSQRLQVVRMLCQAECVLWTNQLDIGEGFRGADAEDHRPCPVLCPVHPPPLLRHHLLMVRQEALPNAEGSGRWPNVAGSVHAIGRMHVRVCRHTACTCMCARQLDHQAVSRADAELIGSAAASHQQQVVSRGVSYEEGSSPDLRMGRAREACVCGAGA